MSKLFQETKNETASSLPQMSLHDAYVGSLQQKRGVANDHLKKVIALYDACQKNQPSEYLVTPTSAKEGLQQKAALDAFINGVGALMIEKGIDRAKDPDGFSSVVRTAYRAMIETHGVERITPAERGGMARYDKWFKSYARAFPIRGERETKEDMKALLSEPMTKEGYGEIAIGFHDPLMGTYIGGVQALVVAKASAGMFIYAFIDPAYQGMGFGSTLVETTKKVVASAAAHYNPTDTRPPAVFLEKNRLSTMPLENILLDSAGIAVLRMPHIGDALGKGAISQSQRDKVWGSLGAQEIKNAGYIQPSLDGVTKIEDPHQRALAIKYLQEAPSLSEAEKKQAVQLIGTALDGKAEHCPLSLCVFSQAKEIEAKQTIQFLSAFYKTSCLDTNEQGLKDDIFSQATLGRLAQQTDANGKLSLTAIKPYGGSLDVKTFREAENVTRALLKVVPLEAVQHAARNAKKGLEETPYSTWLKKYETQIKVELARQAQPTATGPTRPTAPQRVGAPTSVLTKG